MDSEFKKNRKGSRLVHLVPFLSTVIGVACPDVDIHTLISDLTTTHGWISVLENSRNCSSRLHPFCCILWTPNTWPLISLNRFREYRLGSWSRSSYQGADNEEASLCMQWTLHWHGKSHDWMEFYYLYIWLPARSVLKYVALCIPYTQKGELYLWVCGTRCPYKCPRELCNVWDKL